MPNRSKQKGDRAEVTVQVALERAGLSPVKRVPLSGAAPGYPGDLMATFPGGRSFFDLSVEVKCRADGFKQLYQWLSDHDMLVVKADRKDPLFIITAETLYRLVHQFNSQEAP